MKAVVLIALALLVAACESSRTPVVMVQVIACPSEPPPGLPPRVMKPASARPHHVEAYVTRVEARDTAIEIRQRNYIDEWHKCPGRGQ